MLQVRSFRLAGVAVVSFLVGTVAASQSPAGQEILVNSIQVSGDQGPAGLACEQSGFCLILWGFGVFSQDDPPKFEGVRLAATTLAPSSEVVKQGIFAQNRFPVSVSVIAQGERFAAFWGKTVDQGPGFAQIPLYQWFDRFLEPQSAVIALPPLPQDRFTTTDTALIPGGFVQLGPGSDVPDPEYSDGAFLYFSDLAGREMRSPVQVSAESAGEQRIRGGGLAVDLAAGIITVVYSQHMPGDDPDSDIYYRRFSLAGEPLTSDVRVNSYLPHWQIYPAVANTPSGDFVVVWTSDEQDGSYKGIFGQRFTREGLPLGPEFQVNREVFSDQFLEQVATDSAGNFVVVWESYDPSAFGLNAWDIKARLYHADGRPAGPEVFVNRHRELEQEFPLVAFAPNGTFVVTWSSNAQVPPANDNGQDTFVRRFSASPADEPCVVGGGKFWCDTGRTGGELEVRHNFGGGGSGWGFLGDVDADGREDPCVYFGGIFRCDTDHEGGAAEVRIEFAVPGANLPLLGDIDGDGRADPCLAGAGAIHCDTRHDGGTAEIRIVFGQKGETLLLGDLNGDNKAEACAFAGGLFRCDTGHNGGKAELVIPFGRRGDQPLLGDFDGDGRDDPCVFRAGVLLCDTAHNGGAAEGKLKLGVPKDRVVLGNLDGL